MTNDRRGAAGSAASGHQPPIPGSWRIAAGRLPTRMRRRGRRHSTAPTGRPARWGPTDAGERRGGVNQPEHPIDGPQRGDACADPDDEAVRAVDLADLFLDAGRHDVHCGFLQVMRRPFGVVSAASTSSRDGYRSQELRSTTRLRLWCCCEKPVRPAAQQLTGDSLTGYIYAQSCFKRNGTCNARGFL